MAVNKQQSWSIHLFCMKNLLTIVNQKMNVDPLLIAVLLAPRLYGICSQTGVVYGQLEVPLIVKSAILPPMPPQL